MRPATAVRADMVLRRQSRLMRFQRTAISCADPENSPTTPPDAPRAPTLSVAEPGHTAFAGG
jgi:hypothetical protein